MNSVNTASLNRADETAIQATLMGYVDAWNHHDARALAELFTDDAHWINIVGMHWRGKAAIVKAHDVFHRTIFRKTELDVVEVAMRALVKDVAAAVAVLKVGEFMTPDGTARHGTQDRLSPSWRGTTGAGRSSMRITRSSTRRRSPSIP